MSKLLVINAHPEANSTASFGLNVLDFFLKKYREHQSSEEIMEQINLYEDVVPMLDKTVLSAWRKQNAGEELTSEEHEVTRKMDKVLQQFKSARKCTSVNRVDTKNRENYAADRYIRSYSLGVEYPIAEWIRFPL